MDKQDRIAIISDLHLGAHSDDPKWHNIALEYAGWLAKMLKGVGITEIKMLGDIFNNRKDVSVATMHVAYRFFMILKDFDITILVGNHDCFNAEDSTVNSMTMFDQWDNIDVVFGEKQTGVREISKKKYLICPWGTFPDDDDKDIDVIFGHFDISGFYMSKSSMSEKGLSSSAVLDHAPRVFTGHFHLRDERLYDDGTIIYVGSPYQLDWGSADTIKGIYIYDFVSDDIGFIENDFSPKHIKVDMAKMDDEDYVIEISTKIKGNIIKVHSTGTEDVTFHEEALALISSQKPIEVGCDIKNMSLPTFEGEEIKELEPEIALMEYVDLLKTDLKAELRTELKALYISAMSMEKN